MQIRRKLSIFMVVMAMTALGGCQASRTTSATQPVSELDSDSKAALVSLEQGSPTASALADRAKAVLVFPNIVKAGFIVGAQGGDGTLLKKGHLAGYYNTTAVSYGLQAGVQTYGYALYFMSDAVLSSFENSAGWEIGVGPSVVVVDKGMGKDLTTLTGKADIYAFIFDQQGLMAGLGLKGSKITKLSQ
jgi:lipid-binding SYLF domain-containing protein